MYYLKRWNKRGLWAHIQTHWKRIWILTVLCKRTGPVTLPVRRSVVTLQAATDGGAVGALIGQSGGRWPWSGGARTRGGRRIPRWCSACGRAARNAAPVLRQEEEGGSPQHPRPGKTLNSLPLRVPLGRAHQSFTVITNSATGLYRTGETEEQTRQKLTVLSGGN